jgi:hypothetical protein
MTMGNFKFNGNWSFDINLPILSSLHSFNWFDGSYSPDSDSKRTSNLIPCLIVDEIDYNPDPSVSQLSTIAFLIESELAIKDTLFRSFKDEINKAFTESTGSDDWIPEFKSASDLEKIISIFNLKILTEHKEGLSYIQLDCGYIGDTEHGISLILHDNNVIGYSGTSDTALQCVYDDLNVDKNEAFKKMYVINDFGAGLVHKPLEKYNKFKPWQLSATSRHFDELLKNKANNQLKKDIKDNSWDINIRLPHLDKNLVDKSAYYDNIEMVNYFICTGADISESIFQCTTMGIKKQIIKRLVKGGASIDAVGRSGYTSLCNSIISYALALIRVGENQEDTKRATLDIELNNQKREVEFYLSLGANPNSVNLDGETIFNVLSKKWAGQYLEEYKIEDSVRKIIHRS